MRPLLGVLLTLVSTPLFAAPRSCPPVVNGSAILKPGARVLFGEMHGNNETQKLVGELTCNATALGPVRLGLEIPGDEQARLDAYLASDGGAAAKKALLVGPFWSRDTQDGRSSVAMLALIDSVRTLARGGADVQILAFDIPAEASKTVDRDELMAKTLAAAFTREPKSTYLVLVGNLHARKASHPTFKQTFMAQHLVRLKQSVTTLDATYGAGSSWMCIPTCGAYVLGHGAAAPAGVTLSPSKDGAYDGTFSVGAPTFSAPALKPLTDEQRQSVELVKTELEAQRAYDGKQFARCGELNADLARRNPKAGADYGYSAACCFALAGDAMQSFKQLGAAIDGGFKDRSWLEKDTDLTSLHADARWAPLVARLPAPAAAPKKQ